jgi:hypothetical protein
MGVLKRAPHVIYFPRDRNEMNVLRHQTVADECQAVELNALSQQIEINLAISIGTKDELSGVAPLSHVVWQAHGNHTGQTRHTLRLILNNDSVALRTPTTSVQKEAAQ